MRAEGRVTKVAVVRIPYVRPTGQAGHMYVDPTWVEAVAEIDENKCSVLISAQWLDVSMSANNFLTAIGVPIP